MPALRFDRFTFDPVSGELREDGVELPPVRLEPQPAKVLALLLRRAGAVVSREELRAAVWPAETFVDFEGGLTYCVAKIRAALGDAATAPRFVETLPRRGYRFLVPPTEVPGAAPPAAPITSQSRRRRRLWPAVAALAVGIAAALAVALVPRRPPTIAVTLFDNETGAAAGDAVGQRLTDAVVERLAREPRRWSVIGNAAVLRTPRPLRNLQAIAAGLDADRILVGVVQPAAGGVTVLVHFIRADDQRHLWVVRVETPDLLDPGLPDRVAARVGEQLERAGAR